MAVNSALSLRIASVLTNRVAQSETSENVKDIVEICQIKHVELPTVATPCD